MRYSILVYIHVQYIDQITFYYFFLHSTDIMYCDTVEHYPDFVDTNLHLNKLSLLLHYTLLLRCALNTTLEKIEIYRDLNFILAETLICRN